MRPIGGFGARPASKEIAFSRDETLSLEGTSRLKLYAAEISVNAPFKLKISDSEQRFHYPGLVRAQWNRTPLTPQDRFAIGGRYTVRGFDGETSLMGERGIC